MIICHGELIATPAVQVLELNPLEQFRSALSRNQPESSHKLYQFHLMPVEDGDIAFSFLSLKAKFCALSPSGPRSIVILNPTSAIDV